MCCTQTQTTWTVLQHLTYRMSCITPLLHKAVVGSRSGALLHPSAPGSLLHHNWASRAPLCASFAQPYQGNRHYTVKVNSCFHWMRWNFIRRLHRKQCFKSSPQGKSKALLHISLFTFFWVKHPTSYKEIWNVMMLVQYLHFEIIAKYSKIILVLVFTNKTNECGSKWSWGYPHPGVE